MIGQVEIRQAAEGPTLYGVVIQEGRAARQRREVFAPGSVEWPSEGMGVLLEHRGQREIRAIPTRDSEGVIRIEAPATPAIREAVEAGRRFMSVEFHSLEERTTAGGIREIRRAYVPDVALVEDPEYGQTAAELRRSLGSFSGYVPLNRRMDCRCAGQGAGDDVIEVEFDAGAFARVLAGVEDGSRNISAIARGAGDVVADTATDSLSLAATAQRLSMRIRALDTEAGRNTAELVAAGVGVYARPILDFGESEFEVEGRRAIVSAAAFSYILVKPTDRTEGLKPLEKGREGRGRVWLAPSRPLEGQETPILRNGGRRLWL